MSEPVSQAMTSSPFNARTLFGVVLASLLAAAGFVLLSAYAPDLHIGRDGGASVLSKSGTGFSGLFELMTLLDDAPETARGLDELRSDGLAVITIAPQSDRSAYRSRPQSSLPLRRCAGPSRPLRDAAYQPARRP